MFHRRCNELCLTLDLEPTAPLLIKAGEDPLGLLGDRAAQSEGLTAFSQLMEAEKKKIQQAKADEKKQREDLKQKRQDGRGLRDKLDMDMKFVRTLRHGQEEPYLPGSSLKGVLRSRCEQMAATFYEPGAVCNIHDQEGKSSGRSSCTKEVESMPTGERYRAACPVCKLFGCGGLAGRLAISDGYLAGAGQAVMGRRDGVGISRQRGASETGALFDYEVLQTGTFRVTLTLENFELWQVGMTAYVLNDLFTGVLPVGYGSHRGLGRMSGVVAEATLSYFGTISHAAPEGCRLYGVAGLMDGAGYDFLPEGNGVVLPEVHLKHSGLRQMWTLSPRAVEQMWQAGATAWQSVLGLTKEAAR